MGIAIGWQGREKWIANAYFRLLSWVKVFRSLEGVKQISNEKGEMRERLI
jgi:hypothetical protein